MSICITHVETSLMFLPWIGASTAASHPEMFGAQSSRATGFSKSTGVSENEAHQYMESI